MNVNATRREGEKEMAAEGTSRGDNRDNSLVIR